jgi:hypothetical protein
VNTNSEIKGEEAVELFNIVKRNNLLPTGIEELVPLSFIGQAAVSFYRSKIKLMDQLNMTEAQRKATLKDGQEAGEMLLDIEARIGEIAEKEKKAMTTPLRGVGSGRGSKSSGQPPKHERIGIPERRMWQAQAIAKHPDIVAKVKAKARENEDIPTRTAVISEINYQKEKQRRIEAEKNKPEIKSVVSIEQVEYINALDRCISILPQKPPKRWDDAPLKEAKAKAKIIMKRLEVFI